MAQHATIDSNGVLTGFFDDAVNTIPAGAVELTADQYAQWLAGQSTLIWKDGALDAAPAVTATQTDAEKAAALIAGGLAITSTSTPALDATYPTDAATQAKAGALEVRIAAGLGFPGGGSTMPWKDAAGGWHELTQAQFTSLASAISAFVAACDLVIDGFPGATLPDAAATIS